MGIQDIIWLDTSLLTQADNSRRCHDYYNRDFLTYYDYNNASIVTAGESQVLLRESCTSTSVWSHNTTVLVELHVLLKCYYLSISLNNILITRNGRRLTIGCQATAPACQPMVNFPPCDELINK